MSEPGKGFTPGPAALGSVRKLLAPIAALYVEVARRTAPPAPMAEIRETIARVLRPYVLLEHIDSGPT
jgi:hypothetical protein